LALVRNTLKTYKKFAIKLISILILTAGCQTIQNKTDEVVEKENKKYGLFVGGDVNKMRLELGAPSEDIINSIGNEVLIYKTKKYGVPCERRFEVNASGTIIAFSSSGCF
jgi:outer membrane lipoprotein-sorting protein